MWRLNYQKNQKLLKYVSICFRYEFVWFSVVNKVGNGKFWVDETDQRSNLLFISIDKEIVGAPAMVTRLEEVRTI